MALALLAHYSETSQIQIYQTFLDDKGTDAGHPE